MKKIKITNRRDTDGGFMSPLELAKYLGCTRRTIYKKISAGEIPGAKIFGRWKFNKSKVDEWIAGKERTTRMNSKSK